MLELQTHMPLFWFHIDTAAAPQTVIARIRAIVGKSPGWPQSMWWKWRRKDDSDPPFIGTLSDTSFKIQRDIRYSNSFLPMIRGHVISAGLGSRVAVLMYLHPLVALFMAIAIWSATKGHAVLKNSAGAASGIGGWFIPIVAVMIAAGFFPEAWKAKGLISAAAQGAGEDPRNSPLPL